SPVGSSASPPALTSSRPLCVKPRATIERFLGSDSGSRKASEKISALNGFPLEQTFAQEGREAADKSVAGSGAIHALHVKRCHVLHAFTTGKQRTIRTQSDNHSPDTAGKQLGRTVLGIIEIAYRHPGNRFCFTLVGNKVVEVRNRRDVNGLRWSRVQDAADAV